MSMAWVLSCAVLKLNGLLLAA